MWSQGYAVYFRSNFWMNQSPDFIENKLAPTFIEHPETLLDSMKKYQKGEEYLNYFTKPENKNCSIIILTNSIYKRWKTERKEKETKYYNRNKGYKSVEVIKAKDKTNKSDYELAEIFKIDRNINILLVVIFCHHLVLFPLDTRDIWGDIKSDKNLKFFFGCDLRMTENHLL
ncbi:hypothetical protein BpHYR1_030499 [Brachionus plicatilis]|uniref:Uncharacterized protein n=1 Tax=Brachionus plicatilis TaxID=10195 RepID=A0A3M7R815_BRAPC|nr:hypothetical protein BpHYR1_030499 [Brachionus plicatilis]